MSSNRPPPLNWKMPAVQRAYRNALEECLRQGGQAVDLQPSAKRWHVDDVGMTLNNAMSRLMHKELTAAGHGDLASRFSPQAIANHRHRERAVAESRAEFAAQGRARAEEQAQAGPEDPHVAVARDAPLEQPVFRAPSAEVNPPPDDEFASLTYRGRRSPPYSHVNPNDIFRRS
ncbi:hypothetical protein JCM6882_003585 [Rhodosporidiobolus microsporus]